MRVEQDRGRSGGSRCLAEYGRMRAFYFKQPDPFEARSLEPGPGFLGGSAYLAGIVGVVPWSAYRRYGYEAFQAFPDFSEY